ncbi:spore coat protein [Gracilibacillus oryzae]|uniref:Spore coat protein n=1 Tax=Gracilibacillus oryzae TaxID=1672701 RepID=A0A7C8L4V2_9BACI|nr:spore coat protein [Gracilibacillus oryzae]KAB8126978.1 spore coat protein [Gracilibacillus oryzae]
MGKEDLAFHETMDIHELLNMKTVGLLKAKLMQGVIFDQELRALLQKNVDTSVMEIKQLQRLYPYGKTE